MVGVVVFSMGKKFGLGVGVSDCKKMGWSHGWGLWLGLGVAVHELIGLRLLLRMPQPHFAHP